MFGLTRKSPATRRHRKQLPVPPPRDYGSIYFSQQSRELARDLLWEHLSDKQRAQYLASGCKEFRVKGKSGHEYVVSSGMTKTPVTRRKFCLIVGERDPVPIEDQLLAKKLLIECAEDRFLAVANKATY